MFLLINVDTVAWRFTKAMSSHLCILINIAIMTLFFLFSHKIKKAVQMNQ